MTGCCYCPQEDSRKLGSSERPLQKGIKVAEIATSSARPIPTQGLLTVVKATPMLLQLEVQPQGRGHKCLHAGLVDKP